MLGKSTKQWPEWSEPRGHAQVFEAVPQRLRKRFVDHQLKRASATRGKRLVENRLYAKEASTVGIYLPRSTGTIFGRWWLSFIQPLLAKDAKLPDEPMCAGPVWLGAIGPWLELLIVLFHDAHWRRYSCPNIQVEVMGLFLPILFLSPNIPQSMDFEAYRILIHLHTLRSTSTLQRIT